MVILLFPPVLLYMLQQLQDQLFTMCSFLRQKTLFHNNCTWLWITHKLSLWMENRQEDKEQNLLGEGNL